MSFDQVSREIWKTHHRTEQGRTNTSCWVSEKQKDFLQTQHPVQLFKPSRNFRLQRTEPSNKLSGVVSAARNVLWGETFQSYGKKTTQRRNFLKFSLEHRSLLQPTSHECDKTSILNSSSTSGSGDCLFLTLSHAVCPWNCTLQL